MSAFIVTVLKIIGSIVSGGLLFQAFVASNHAKPITKIAGILVSLVTLLMFFSDIKDILPDDEADKTEQIYWESVEKHPSAQTYRNYLREYPDGKFVAIARTQIANYANAIPATDEQHSVPSPQHAKISDDKTHTESMYWEIVEKYPSAEAYRAYLNKYPNGHFVALAQAQLAIYMKPPLVAKEQQPIASVATQTSTAPDKWQMIGQYQVKGSLVKDTKTGLMWMRCSLGQHWQGSTCEGQSTGYQWEQAMDISGHFDYAGYKDWRVPTRQELKTLVSCSSGQTERLEVGRSLCDGDYARPTIVNAAFPETPGAWFWSSSLDGSYGSTAWGINFTDGYDGWDFKYSNNRVRLVRSGHARSNWFGNVSSLDAHPLQFKALPD
jgi:hypothetical protein